MKKKTLTFSYDDFPDAVETPTVNDIEAKILDLAKHGKKLTKDNVAKYLKITYHRAKYALNKLEQEGKLRSKSTMAKDISGRSNNARLYYK